ncbi:MAG TPA: adenine deaminase [Patescibacteria group bacterium]|nr:adenine deaminase [Patescibacteria group bacterium]
MLVDADDERRLRARINTALGRRPADLVLKNGRIFNVFTGEFETGDVAVVGGVIAGVGDYQGQEEIDLAGAYITPGFIDGHVHLESAMVSPSEFARGVVPAGTTTVVADPHEIANVCGAGGIRYMLAATEALPLTVYFMLPSCVPATEMETAGAVLNAAALQEFVGHPRVLGLGELMDYPGVINGRTDVLQKILLAQDKRIDGHGPGLKGKELTAYIAAGARSDHECVTVQEAWERLRQGMWLMLREGSAAHNLLELLPAVTPVTMERCMLVTDDRQPKDLLQQGHINHLVRLAVAAGVEPARVLRLATLNAARYFGLERLGAVAPGYLANLLVFDELSEFRPRMVFCNGRLAAKNGQALFAMSPVADETVRQTMRLPEPAAMALRVSINTTVKRGRARVMGLVPGQLVTRELIRDLPVRDGGLQADVIQDVVKVAVWERHHGTGRVGVSFLEGLGLKSGAIASSIAHDSHHLVAAGCCDEDMVVAATAVRQMGGGIVVVKDGKVLGELPLPLAGLMADRTLEVVQKELEILHHQARELGVDQGHDPFMTLAFVSLPVIPELKLTDLGLVDVDRQIFVSTVME